VGRTLLSRLTQGTAQVRSEPTRGA
jgi:hypothetical protein